MIPITCSGCGLDYPSVGLPHICPVCGEIFELSELPVYSPSASANFPGIWRYRSTFGLDDSSPIITLGEGRTPLIEDSMLGKIIYNKLDYQNPTGSSHDRGAAVLINHILRRGIENLVVDTAGNAGVAIAAYATRAGINARVFMPATTLESKKKQVEFYGGEVVLVEGSRVDIEHAAQGEASPECVYASLAHQVFGQLGAATIAFEIYESLGRAPGTIIVPVGHGGLLLGIIRGFQSLIQEGHITDLPLFVGVQSRACAPVCNLFSQEQSPLQTLHLPLSVGDEMQITHPVHGERLVQALSEAGGDMIVIEAGEIGTSRDQLARRGYYVEPIAAMTWAALRKSADRFEEPVVLVLTGSGFNARI